ncbi:hypothetical protein BH23CHL5_BH23CHL5_27810 [soil metagenome]
MVEHLFAALAHHAAQIAQPRPGEHVLDVGCGSGLVARAVYPMVVPTGSVTGIDVDIGALNTAKRLSAANHMRIDWRVCPSEHLPFADGLFDLVICQAALPHFTDQLQGLREMSRVLRKRGRLVLVVFQSLDCHPIHSALKKVMRAFIAPEADPSFSLGSPAQLQNMLISTGFDYINIVPFSLAAHYGTPDACIDQLLMADVNIGRLRGELSHQDWLHFRKSLSEHMAEVLEAAILDGQVFVTYHVQIGLATA